MARVAVPVTDRRPPADRALSRLPERQFDALLVVAFGGPEGPDDVIPFLENVTRGRGVPHERLLEVAKHYDLFGGVSPINAQNRELIAAVERELAEHAIDLPVYFGNRNWHPLLTDTLREMRDDGVRKALAFFTSPFSSYSGCRQYRENIFEAQQEVGPDAPEVLKLRLFHNHPGLVEANVDRLRAALGELPGELRGDASVAFTAHSIPAAMAKSCAYEAQLRETARLVADAAGVAEHDVVYQSRSGSPHAPWLEPDVCDHLRALAARGARAVVLAPLGFVSDHLEVLYDLDHEAREVADELGLAMVRAGTPGTHPAFVSMIRELIGERLGEGVPQRSLGRLAVGPDVCAPDCCLPGTGRPSPWE
ncbi:MAG: ferrochelatase [Gaiellaceae bacterium]